MDKCNIVEGTREFVVIRLHVEILAIIWYSQYGQVYVCSVALTISPPLDGYFLPIFLTPVRYFLSVLVF